MDSSTGQGLQPHICRFREAISRYQHARPLGAVPEDLWILVVVDRNEETKTGVVKTAHLLKTVKPDETRTVWLKPE